MRSHAKIQRWACWIFFFATTLKVCFTNLTFWSFNDEMQWKTLNAGFANGQNLNLGMENVVQTISC